MNGLNTGIFSGSQAKLELTCVLRGFIHGKEGLLECFIN